MKIPQTLVEFPPFLTQSGCCTVRVLLVSLHHCWDDFIADFPLIKADCLGVLNQSKPPQEHANRAKGSSVHWGVRRRPHMGVRTSVQLNFSLNFCPKASLQWDTQSHQNRPNRPTDLNSEEFKVGRKEWAADRVCVCQCVFPLYSVNPHPDWTETSQVRSSLIGWPTQSQTWLSTTNLRLQQHGMLLLVWRLVVGLKIHKVTSEVHQRRRLVSFAILTYWLKKSVCEDGEIYK